MLAPISKVETVENKLARPLTTPCKLIVPAPANVKADEPPAIVFENLNVEPVAALMVEALPKVTAPLTISVPDELVSFKAVVPFNVSALPTVMLLLPEIFNAAPEVTLAAPVPNALPLLIVIAPALIVVPPV